MRAAREADRDASPEGDPAGAAGGTTLSFGIIVLAGGAAERLGRADKPALTVGGRTMLESVIAAGLEAGARRVVIVGPERRAAEGTVGPRRGPADGTAGPEPGGADGIMIIHVREEPPGAGPVPALRRGLAEVTEEWVGVVGADLPFLRADHLRALLRAAGARRGAVLADDAGRPQWVAGGWRASALRTAAAGYRGGSLRGLLGPLEPVMLHLPPAPGEPPPWLDCDTPEDLRRARAWSGR